MKNSMLVVLLTALILALLIPVTNNSYNSGQAFTSDNLVRPQMIYNNY